MEILTKFWIYIYLLGALDTSRMGRITLNARRALTSNTSSLGNADVRIVLIKLKWKYKQKFTILFVCIVVSCPSQQVFSHNDMEALLLGVNKYYGSLFVLLQDTTWYQWSLNPQSLDPKIIKPFSCSAELG